MRSEARSSGKIGGEVKRRRDRRRDQSGEIERYGAAIDERRGAIVGLELGLWSPAKSLLPLSFSGSLFLLHVEGNSLKVK